ncbi:hypothetical protein QUF49_15555 [Fictibacillus sp. b24]|uniref:hypothetical protein n=1 Tax=Fictibacillus sp. b24 TaxID=3055863 RepID=UPI0025A2F582|nr:hypothetical protein [Fictibacillus sp. b24]MDM5317426.1 hypothetical protein [Fictibacillus sp. b24]
MVVISELRALGYIGNFTVVSKTFTVRLVKVSFYVRPLPAMGKGLFYVFKQNH